MRKLSMLTAAAALVAVRHVMGKSSSLLVVAALALGAVALTAGPAKAVELQDDDQFVLDFIANGDGPTNLSNFPVAVYWKWDGANTLGIRMETPQGSGGHGALWSFNVF